MPTLDDVVAGDPWLTRITTGAFLGGDDSPSVGYRLTASASSISAP